MNLSNYDKTYLGKKAEELGFIRDTLEKVTRLADILEYLNTNSLLKESLALKGGTAINLTVFNLPRLSVDIDLDYMKSESKEQMMKNRDIINSDIDRYMTAQGYNKSPKTKNPLSLDSWVYTYINGGGNKDNIKIEVNYSLRNHILPSEERPIITEQFSSDYKVNSLAVIEIFASKFNALLSRAAARDLYDIGNMIKFGLFDESEQDLLRKCIVFYAAISSKKINKTFDVKLIDTLNIHKIRTDLLPVLRKRDDFDLEVTKKAVKKYVTELMVLTKPEKEFLDHFENKEYVPQLLFEDADIIERIENHPMALWKIKSE